MPTLIPSLFAVLLSPTAAAAPTPGDLVISEVMPNPRYVSPGQGEWFEVTNVSSGSLNLNGIEVGSSGSPGFTIDQDVVIAAGQTAVLASSTNNAGLPRVDFTYTASHLQLSNSGDDITLTAGGVELDMASFGGAWGASTQLNPATLTAAANDVRGSWCQPISVYGSGNLGTPGSANDSCPAALSQLLPGDIITSELMIDPLQTDRGEWIEVQNLSAYRIDLNGLEVATSSELMTVGSSIILEPGEVAVLANHATSNGGVTADWAAAGLLTLDDQADEVLLSYQGTEFHRLAYDASVDPVYTGTTLRVDTGMAVAGSYDQPAAWCVEITPYRAGDHGTPGEDNGDCGIDVDGDGVAFEGDCDDANADTHPWASEICDLEDNDCNGVVDDGALDVFTYYTDADADGYGDLDAPVHACMLPSGAAEQPGDCDDADATRSPAADEVCDDIDNDCDDEVDESAVDATTYYVDADADGFGSEAASLRACSAPAGYATEAGDCDDTRWAVRPDASEVCDLLDNDCDGTVDEEPVDGDTYYADRDGDGFGGAGETVLACTQPAGFVRDGSDCDDTTRSAYPGANEVCDSIDNDCDSEVDEGVLTTWYADSDGDRYGDPNTTEQACSAPTGFVAVARDCDDTNAAVSPAEVEVCDRIDNDCNGVVDECGGNRFYRDADGDGFGDPSTEVDGCFAPEGYVTDRNDCDDTDPNLFPGNAEVCDGADNDCDGEADEGLDQTWYADTDGDGFGDGRDKLVACEQPDGYVLDNTDCNDTTALAYPGNTEVCDELDNDCDRQIDEGVTTTFWRDRDADGHGDWGSDKEACSLPEGYATIHGDCNDRDETAFPGGTETCDRADNDCDGTVDEGLELTFYRDVDKDGYGNPADPRDACEKPPGYVDNSEDCNDWHADSFPGAEETCDGQDNDCDGVTDEEGVATFYFDADGDGYGTDEVTVETCPAPQGYVAAGGDCDDSDPTRSPGIREVCDGIDNNCRGGVDEELTREWYADADADGYGDPEAVLEVCKNAADPVGYVRNDNDCNDGDASIKPWAQETCDGVDQDCDGEIDDNTGVIGYIDADGDGYGDPATAVDSCNLAAGYIPQGGDCDDTDAQVNPDKRERCDGIDNDCNGEIDEGLDETFYADRDGDGSGVETETIEACELPAGYAETFGDCDDADPLRRPGREEVCDGIDNDCDTVVDEEVTTSFYVDADADGFGDDEQVVQACEIAAGLSEDGGDCDDSNPAAFPGNLEVCDEVDNNCDEQIDEEVQTLFYADRDGDGLGNPSDTLAACEQPEGYVENSDDCNDTDGVSGDSLVFYIDEDGDGHGTTAETVEGCTPPPGYSAFSDDCDDTDPNNFPGNEETCDGVDNNCNVAADEGALELFYADVDADGFGDAREAVEACSAPEGYVADDTDCDDTQPSVNPGMEEVCDELDNDCNDEIDEGVSTTFWADRDVDGYGDPDVMILACDAQVCEKECFFVENDLDCDDDRPEVHPGMSEVCDGLDNDCDGDIDEELRGTFYADTDGDGYGDPDSPVESCGPDAVAVTDSTDCDDSAAAINPGAAEACDELDNDCDSLVDEDEVCAEEEPETPEEEPETPEEEPETPEEEPETPEEEPATKRALWVRTDGLRHSAPDNTERFGSSEAAALLEARGLDWDSVRLSEVDFNAELMSRYEIIILFGKGVDGPLSQAQADDLEDFVADGGGLMYHTFHPSDASCDMLDSLPESFGLSCVEGNRVLRGAGVPVMEHALTQGVNQITINGGEEWEVSGNAQVVVRHTQGYVLVAAAELGEGRVVAIADEWPLYNSGTSKRWDIGAFHNERLVDNSFCWLTSDDCDVDPTWYLDADGDGFGDPSESVQAAEAPEGYVADATDCDDADALSFPGAAELCDELDNDCDDDVDEDVVCTVEEELSFCSAADGTTRVLRDPATPVDVTDLAALGPAAVAVSPIHRAWIAQVEGATWVWETPLPTAPTLDQQITLAMPFTLPEGVELVEATLNIAADNRYWASINGERVDDTVGGMTFRSAESWDVTDAIQAGDNRLDVRVINWAGSANPKANPAGALFCVDMTIECSGDCPEPEPRTWYLDADGDGYGDPSVAIVSATAPEGFVADDTDCDDRESRVHPAGVESCDELDNDCDGLIDEGVGQTWYLDADGDGYGTLARSAESCEAFGDFNSVDPRDCDDAAAKVHPAATEVCDEIDNDCDRQIDEDLGRTWFVDADGDGFGAEPVVACEQPDQTSTRDGDCDDDASNVHPGAEDVCDYIDNDCDGVRDENPEFIYNADRDGDGYGDPVEFIAACAPPEGFIADDTDCNDSDRSTHPGAEEACDGVDNDCDGAIETAEECPVGTTYTVCSAEDGWNRQLANPSTPAFVSDVEALGPAAVEVEVGKQWKADIDGAAWIWVADEVDGPRKEQEAVFARPFRLSPDVEVISATLDIAADKFFTATLNGTEVASDEKGRSKTEAMSFDVGDALRTGRNRLDIEVEGPGNNKLNASGAGLLYCLDIEVSCTTGTCPELDVD